MKTNKTHEEKTTDGDRSGAGAHEALLGEVGEFDTEYIDLDSEEKNKCIWEGLQKDRLRDGLKYNKIYTHNGINYVIHSVSIDYRLQQRIQLKRLKFVYFA